MAIQFFCVACRQPIEIDDEFANQTVTCPYCRKVVTAPATTDQTIQDNPPIAAPSDVATTPASPTIASEALPRKNVLGWTSLVSVSVTLVIIAILIGIQVSIFKSLPPDTRPQDASKAINEEIQKRSGVVFLSILGSCVTPLIAVVCGIVGLVKRERPRWPAITSLVICGLMILFMCVVLSFAVMAAGGKPAG